MARWEWLIVSNISSTSDGMGNNPASAWFHNSLQHLSHSWHRFNKFDISRDKKADRCSTWFVDQANNNNKPVKPLPFYSFARRTISEESIDFFDRFSKISERANTQRIPAGRRGQQPNANVVEEAFARADRINQLDRQRGVSSPQLSDGSDEAAESAPFPTIGINNPHLTTEPLFVNV
ncbi:hypothetical protein DAPPUDRAFT_241145 [Daphnia pulex]|uniref:Uncharacterized protein n=1 Tax=Daphnia pulex TaxID=6669 RepID=E9GDI7_DAPPU|nr:hypothetical protein DAPPUDRAFT_241145 [Daphnia pulex]|eukprot:EFX82089.1 hypothetical protein DAPPUDRAFT_241145 [Daphnia pulex]